MAYRTRDYIAMGVTLVLIALALGVFSATVARALVYPEAEEEITVHIETDWKREGELPARLIIPTIGVDALVEYVGVGASGNMAVPQSYGNVGWYRLGAIPGDRGSAVMAGHVTNGLQLPGVFYRLGQLTEGDEIVVEAANGEQSRFVVIEVRTYDLDEVPTERVFGQSNGNYLNLITCEGDWLVRKRMYDQRTVVYTERISSS